MEAVVVTGVHRVHDGEQTADSVVDRGQELAVLGGVDAAFEIFAAAHVEVGFHAAAQKSLVEELAVTAADIFRCGVGDVFLVRLPAHLVTELLHEVYELLARGAVLHGLLDGAA